MASIADQQPTAVDYLYLWADGIHVNIRLEEHKLCLLVLIGIRADGHKEFITLADGYRESAESWADLLCNCAHRSRSAWAQMRTSAGPCDGRGEPYK